MATTFKLYADKMGATDPTTYIGRDGDIFYDPDNGSLKISDGVTPGGISIGGGGGGLADVVQDTSPQLGGTLDINGQQITGSLIPSANTTYDIGTQENSWRDLYLSGNTIYLGGVALSANTSTGSIELPAGSTIGGTEVAPAPDLQVIAQTGATVAAPIVPDFQGGITSASIGPATNNPGAPIQISTNANVTGSLSATVSVDVPVGSVSANSAQFTSADIVTLTGTTSLSGHTVPGGSGTVALTSDIPAMPNEDFVHIAPGVTTVDLAAAVIANGSFVTTDETTPVVINPSVTVTSGFTAVKIEISMTGWDHVDGANEIYLDLEREINGASTTKLKELIFPAGNNYFGSTHHTHVDVHGASAGDTVSYKLKVNSIGGTGSFRLVTGISGDSVYIKEVP